MKLADLPQTHLNENLRLLRDRSEETADLIASQSSRTDIRVSFEGNRLPRCERKTESGTIQVLGGTRPSEVEVQHEHDEMRAAWMAGSQIVFLFGTGLGCSILPLAPLIRTPQVTLIAIEPDPGLIYTSFCLFDWKEILDCRGFHLLVGLDTVEPILTLIRNHRYDWVEPDRTHVTYGYPWRNTSLVKKWDEIVLGLGEGFLAQHNAINATIKDRRSHYPSKKPYPKRVLLLCSNSSSWGPIIRGLTCGFEAAGYESRVALVPAVITQDNRFLPTELTGWRLFEETFLRFKPDLVVVLNVSSNFWLTFPEMEVPRVVWVVDSATNMPDVSFHPRDYVILSDEWDRDEVLRRGGRVIGEVPMAASEIETEFDPQLACDVSFVGTVPDTSKIHSAVSSAFQTWLDGVVETYFTKNLILPQDALDRHDPPPDPGPGLTKNVPRHSTNLGAAVYYLLCLELNRRRRLEVLTAVADLGLRIYGNPEWKEAVRSTPLEQCVAGERLTPSEAYQLYRSSRISLNIHTVIPHGTVNQRDMEVPAAGGFLISDLKRYTGGRPDRFFDPETEVPAYSDPGELRELVKTFLSDDERRQTMARRAKERVFRGHSDRSRAERMIQLLQDAGAWS